MKLAIAVKGPVIKYRGKKGGGAMNFFGGPPLSYLTKLGRPTPGVARKKVVTYPPTKTSNFDVDRYIREHWLTTFIRISKKSSRSKCE